VIQRKITNKLLTALSDSPVVLLHGARQTGKSTLIESLTDGEYPARYLTFDDPGILSAAKNNPVEFLAAYDENLAIDEVQRVPEIFPAIKNIVDRKRKPGRFILTGSSNVLLIPKISESLAGRIEILNLYPFSQNEITSSDHNFIDDIFKKNYRLPQVSGRRYNLIKKITTGGFPEMLLRKDKERQDAWFKSYITTILQRDVRDIANIEKLSELPNLLKLFAARAGTLLNFAEFSRSSAIPQTTLKRYIALLEAIFMINLLPAWSGNLSKRLIKTPKLYLSDTGLLSHLTAFESEKLKSDPLFWGRVLENFVLLELIKQASWSRFGLSLFHFRTSAGQEVDFVIERKDGSLIGIEVKAAANISADTFRHLNVFAEETGKKFLRGVVFYTGSEPIPFAKNMFALPIDTLCL
jgi:predicted AAA+ superfamily ATPase